MLIFNIPKIPIIVSLGSANTIFCSKYRAYGVLTNANVLEMSSKNIQLLSSSFN